MEYPVFKMTRVYCDKKYCKNHSEKEDICKLETISIEDQGNCFSCNNYEEKY